MVTPRADPETAAAINSMKDQLLITLVKRLGGNITIPVSEIDGTGQDLLNMGITTDKKYFTFIVSSKSSCQCSHDEIQN